MRASIRLFLLLNALAAGAVAAVVLLVLGLPLAARHGLGPATLGALAAAVGVAVLLATTVLLFRGIARPVERLLETAGRLGQAQGAEAGDLPILGEAGAAGGPALSRAAVAFERLALAFGAERARLAAKVQELTEANSALALARESLLRSERLATVGRLAAGLAHEVGNPLGAITGYVELARTRLPQDADPELPGALARIEAAAVRIDRTVRELLDFARPVPPALGPVRLAPVVDTVLRLAGVQARFRDVESSVAIPPDLPHVLADEHQLSQVLLNLLLNAGDAMDGRGRIEITARAGDEGDGVLLTVADSGTGIARSDLDRIFDPFFTTKEPGKGSGLGLAISHRIVESFGGSLVAANRASGGAEFTVRLRSASPR